MQKNAFDSSKIKVKYKFVRMCRGKEIPDIESLLSSPYHTLPYAGDCDECKVAGRNEELLKAWNEALKKVFTFFFAYSLSFYYRIQFQMSLSQVDVRESKFKKLSVIFYYQLRYSRF